ncbi:MAG: serine/threonine protein kinase with domain [Deltaproteobacteria bacterium]|nr:serine/threonine protein kinase with domain [Deltaproteobacteria bacterium]
MPQNQPIRFGKYLLLKKQASGGMAHLYRAKIIGVQGFEKFVAIKQILPHLAEEEELVNSFIHEAKLAALLNHQNIVQIYDFGHLDGVYFITMEYLFGKDLRLVFNKLRESGQRIPIEHVLYIASRVFAGLDYAHHLKDFQGKPLKIIHRDISPQNIIITYEGDVKIVDFGIAKASNQSAMTQVGMIKGKVAYMSPEQATGRPIDHRSDIFSGGILLYEMITGNRMFKGEDTLQILAKVQEADFAPLRSVRSDLPEKLYGILDRALAKDPENRYSSAGEMQADLDECLFLLSMRPAARGLAEFMKGLFRTEIAAESSLMGGAEPSEERRESAAGETMINAPVEPVPIPSPTEPAATGKKSSLRLSAGIAAVVIAVVAGIAIWSGRTPPAKTGAESPPGAMATPAATANAPAASGRTEPPQDKAASPQAVAQGLRDEAARLSKSDSRKSKSLLLKATELDPGNVQGQLQLARIYVKEKDYPKAVEVYNRVASIAPKFPDSYFNLGYIYAVNKDYKRAEEMYERTAALSPLYLDEALFNLGMVQDKQGKRQQSIANLEKAVRVNPKNEPARKLLEKLKGKP